MEEVNCVLCDIDDTRPYQEEGGYQSVQCNRCGLVYVNPRPSIDEMKQLYQGQETKINLHAHLNQRDFKSVQARRCLKFILPHKNSGRLLEIGSAAGYFINQARTAGFEVQGLDLTRQFCEFSRDVLRLEVFEGTLAQAPFEDQRFDVIYMRNVLSHLANPVHEFKVLHRLLKPGGIVVLETGNVAELPANDAVELELPDHLYHFSEATIKQLFEAAGLQGLKAHRFVLLDSFKIIQLAIKLSGKLKQMVSPPSVKKPAGDNNFPTQLPKSHLALRMSAHLAQFSRYGLGSVLPKTNQRCTLVMVAQRRRS